MGYVGLDYDRDWRDRRNAAGFAAECARLALPFYKGNHRSNVVAAIELAERYASGEETDGTAGSIISNGVGAGGGNAADAAYYAAACADGGAAYYAAAQAEADADAAADAAYAAFYAGVDTHEIRAAYARWAVRDLSDGRDLPVELRQAAGAAVVAGDEALAKEILA